MQIVAAYSESNCIYNKINLIVPVWKEQDNTFQVHMYRIPSWRERPKKHYLSKNNNKVV